MKITIGDGFLEYDRLGDGIPLLFIHGFPLSRMIWSQQLVGLSDIASLISLDLRGHGDSFSFEGPYPMDLFASDCMELLTDLHVNQPVIVCGHSMGGYVTLALYRMHPEIFKGMILTSTRPGADSPGGKANRDVVISSARNSGSRFIAENMLQKLFSPTITSTKTELIEFIRNVMEKTSIQGIIGASQGMKERPDSTTLLPRIACPVLIIHGTDDQLVPINEAILMDQIIPNSRLVKISEAGHLPNLEQPDIFNQAVREFLGTLV